MSQNNDGRPPFPFSDDEWTNYSDTSQPQQAAQQSYDATQEPAQTERMPFQATDGNFDTTFDNGFSSTQDADPYAYDYAATEPPVSATSARATHFASDEALSVAQAPVKKGSGTLKSLLVGLAGGAVSAAVVSLALNAFGVTGVAKTASTGTAESSAGQTISINANTEDATVAKAVAAKALPSVVSVTVTSSQGTGMGSGAVLDKDGNIITNYHVVEGAQSVSVTINGKSYDATVVGTDASSDIAVVHAELNGDEVTPIEIGDSDALVVGDWVMTIGSPFGLDQSVSAGIVSSLSRNQLMTGASGNTLYANLIQTDAAINPGNSGGPLVNSEGQLVGIDTLFSSDTESFAGIGFAIPGNYAIEVANKIIAGEQVTHAYIGVTMQTVNAQNAQQYHLSVNQGAYVAEVTAGSPADEAGLQPGDIIIALDGEEITSADGMILAVRSHKIGETVQITFMRGTDEMTADVTFGDDAELQKLQQEQQNQQQQQQDQGYGIESPYGERRDYGEDMSYEDIFNYFFNNNGGRNGQNGFNN